MIKPIIPHYWAVPGIRKREMKEFIANVEKHTWIVGKVAEFFGITPSQLLGLRRTREFVIARHIAIYFTYRLCFVTKGRAGKLFNRDHTTTIYAIQQVEIFKAVDPAYRRNFDRIEEILNS